MTSPTLGGYLPLLMPATADIAVYVVEADGDWSFGGIPRDGDGILFWGRPPLRLRGRPVVLLKHATNRERALLTVKKRHSDKEIRMRRLQPPAANRRATSAALRGFLMSGAVMAISSEHVPTVLDSVAAEAGVQILERSLDLGSDGAGVVRVRDGSRRAFLRLASSHASSDPTSSARALRALRKSGVSPVPEVLNEGATSGCRWALESALRGAVPHV